MFPDNKDTQYGEFGTVYGNLCAWGKQYVSKEEKTIYMTLLNRE